jgi:hypothetical protein
LGYKFIDEIFIEALYDFDRDRGVMVKIPDDATGQALKRLITAGSDLTKPMEVDFFIAVESKEEGDQIAAKVQDVGFKTSLKQDTVTLDWTCYCTKTIIPQYLEVIEIEQQLSSISELYGGYLDGFSSYGNVIN